MKAGRKVDVQPLVIAEVAESEMFQMHGDNMNWKKSGGEFFHAGNSELLSSR